MATDKPRDVWAPFKFFLGSWEGVGESQSGKSRTDRDYAFVLSGKFLRVRNRSTFEPTEKNPKGEVHEDVGYYSYDGSRKKFVFRQFHVEGFVNQYLLDSLAEDSKKIVFVTERIENIPSGWRARETYMITGDDDFTELFELAAPGKDFQVCVKNHLKRKP